jgi:hypothetical protein
MEEKARATIIGGLHAGRMAKVKKVKILRTQKFNKLPK